MDFKQLSDVFLLPANLLIVGATLSILIAVKKMFVKATDTSLYARIEPLLPVVVATVLVFLPREAVEPMKWGDRIVLGVGLGMFASLAFKTWRTSIMGSDERITPTQAPVVVAPLPDVSTPTGPQP